MCSEIFQHASKHDLCIASFEHCWALPEFAVKPFLPICNQLRQTVAKLKILKGWGWRPGFILGPVGPIWVTIPQNMISSMEQNAIYCKNLTFDYLGVFFKSQFSPGRTAETD